MQSPVKDLLDKEMDRHEFLVHIGAGLLALIGFSSILRFLNARNAGSNSSSTSHGDLSGYGGSAYGR